MKHILTILAVAALVVSCGSKSDSGIAKGEVIDATMNNVKIITTTNDTLTFSTMALVDSGNMIAVFIGDSLEVAYSSLEVNEHPHCYNATDVKLIYRSPFYYLVGEWVEPNPIDSTAVQGFVFNDDNSASSINMATLKCSQWSYDNGTLTLTMTSKGNKVESTSEELYDVVTLNDDSLVLSQNGNIIWKLGRAK